MSSSSSAPGTQRASSLAVQIIPNWLGQEEADGLLAYAIASESGFSEAGLRYEKGETRVDHMIRKACVNGDLGPYKETVRNAAAALAPTLQQTFSMGAFPVARVESELASHGDGAHFTRHIDTVHHRGPHAGSRALTLVYYLNREPKSFSGGILRIYSIFRPGEFIDVEPQHNLLVAFPSFIPHSVEPISCPSGQFADHRFAVNLWLHRPTA